MTEDNILQMKPARRHSALPRDFDSAFNESRLRPMRISGESNRDGRNPSADDYKFDQAYAAFCRSFRPPAEMKGAAARSTFMGCVVDICITEKETDHHKLDAKAVFNEMLRRLQEIFMDMQ